MKRFEFRLQAVLTLRHRTEQEAVGKFAQCLRVREAAARRLHELETELSDTRRQWLNEMADGCPAVRAAQTLAYCHSLEERRNEATLALREAEANLDQASDHMLIARQQRQAVETLLHHQQSAYEARVRLEDQKILDDLVGRRLPISLSSGSLQRPFLN